MKQIVIATDGSPSAREAVDVGLELAKDQGADVTFVHVLPAEEFVRIARGSDNGWPYCFMDAVFEHRKVLAPEYGGDGQRVSGGPGIDCSTYTEPLVNFGAHWAPNGMHF